MPKKPPKRVIPGTRALQRRIREIRDDRRTYGDNLDQAMVDHIKRVATLVKYVRRPTSN
jgi:hypothetical protein